MSNVTTWSASVGEEIERFAAYLDEHPRTTGAYADASLRKYETIATLGAWLSVMVDIETDPARGAGTDAQRLARLRRVRAEFERARTRVREMFRAWLA